MTGTTIATPGPARALGAMLLAAVIAACGAGKGTERFLAPGPATTAPPSNDVLYVSLATSNRVEAFRLGTDGLLPAKSFSAITVSKPRNVLLADDVLFVALRNEIVSLDIRADGSLPTSITGRTRPIFESDPTEMLIVGDVLYGAFTGVDSVLAFRLRFGHVTSDILSSSGLANSNYRPLAHDAVNRIIYAGTRINAQIDAFLINPDGSLDGQPIIQLDESNVFGPEDLIVRGDMLYAVEQERERINAYEINATGLLPEDPHSHTLAEERYADIALMGDRLYASAFNRGRIDVYEVAADGSLPEQEPLTRTREDTSAFPNQMIVANGILYVAQGGLDRIDAYVIGANGTIPRFPSSSTDPMSDRFADDDGFPNGLVLGSYPP